MSIPATIRKTTALFPPSGDGKALTSPEGGSITACHVWYSPSVKALVAVQVELAGSPTPTMLVAGLADVSDATLQKSSYTPGLTAAVIGWTVVSTPAGICQLLIHQQAPGAAPQVVALGQDPVAGGLASPQSAHADIDLSDFAAFGGVVCAVAASKALASCELVVLAAGPFPLGGASPRRWVPASSLDRLPASVEVPELDPAAYVLFEDQEVLWVAQDELDLTIHRLKGFAEHFKYAGRNFPDDALQNRYLAADGRLLLAKDSDLTVPLTDGTVLKLSPQRAYPDLSGSPDALTFGATFNQPNRSHFDLFFLRGFDIYAMNPFNLQHPTGLRDELFRSPPSDSKEYHTGDGGDDTTPTPNGVYRNPNTRSQQSSKTVELSSESSYQEQLSVGVGVNAGVTGFGSFSANAEYRSSLERDFSNRGGSTLTTGVALSHDHVLDLSRVEFGTKENGFLDRLTELATRAKSQTATSADYDQFVKQFGTHYAYGIRFGGRFIFTHHYSKASMAKKTGEGLSLSVEASASIEGVFSVGVSERLSGDVSTSVRHEEGSDVTELITIGGEASKDGFQLGTRAVPILLDLRPISELLNPVLLAPIGAAADTLAGLLPLHDTLFDKVKAGIDAACVRRSTGNGAKAFSTVDVRPTVLEVSIDRVDFQAGFNDLSVEPKYVAAALYIRPPRGFTVVGNESTDVKVFSRGVGLEQALAVGSRRLVMGDQAVRGAKVPLGVRLLNLTEEGDGPRPMNFTAEGAGFAMGLPTGRMGVFYTLRRHGSVPKFLPQAIGIGMTEFAASRVVNAAGDVFLIQSVNTASGRAEAFGWSASSGWTETILVKATPLAQVSTFADQWSFSVTDDRRVIFVLRRGGASGTVEVHTTSPLTTAGDATFVTQTGTNFVPVSAAGAATAQGTEEMLVTIDPVTQSIAASFPPYTFVRTYPDVGVPVDAKVLAMGLYGKTNSIGGSRASFDLALVYRQPGKAPVYRVLSGDSNYTAFSRQKVFDAFAGQGVTFSIAPTHDQEVGGLFIFTPSTTDVNKVQVLPWAEC